MSIKRTWETDSNLKKVYGRQKMLDSKAARNTGPGGRGNSQAQPLKPDGGHGPEL